MFKLFADILLEASETNRWVTYNCLRAIDAICVKLMRRLEK